jgi:hypothetical protein
VATIDDSNFGAWLIKCNPMLWDFYGFIALGNDTIDNWSVVDNYRSQMMRQGELIVFWVSGTDSTERGIWGTGYIVGEAHDVPSDEVDGDDADGDDTGYWLSEKARLAVTNGIDVDIPLFDAVISDSELRAAGIDDLEVQRMPQGSNPSWISKEQLARLTSILPPWPEYVELEDEITITDAGAGFGDPLQNQIVELAAVAAVGEFYRNGNWDVHDVSLEKLGWDLTCTHTSGESARVEVKGVSSDRPIVLLTARELRAAANEPDWVLAVVTRAVSAPVVTEFTAEQALKAANPYVFKADLTPFKS